MDESHSIEFRLTALLNQLGVAPSSDHASNFERFASADGDRVLFWPFGKPAANCQLIGLVTSRIGRKLDEKDEWFQRLRLACGVARQQQTVVVTAEDAAAYEFISRSAELFRIATVRVIQSERISVARWFDWAVEQSSRFGVKPSPTDAAAILDAAPNCWPVIISPIVVGSRADLSDSQDESTDPSSIPIQDRVTAALSEQLWVMSLRRNGNWHRLIQQRLADSSRSAGNVRLIDGDDSLQQSFANDLHEQGAVRWCLANSADSSFEETALSEKKSESCGGSTATEEYRRRLQGGDEFLVHWTRMAAGPWPSETQREFLDGYILSESPDRSAFGTLNQIVQEGTLRASSKGIRSDQSVISFTAITLSELLLRRHFQTHRNRWDFEHYGLCISKTVLEAQGAKSVIYGDDQDWSNLADCDRPWFQQATSKTRSTTINWSSEAEWRCIGDLDLNQISTNDCFLFTATTAEARLLANQQRFGVVSIEELQLEL
jgi:hypothetical protein